MKINLINGENPASSTGKLVFPGAGVTFMAILGGSDAILSPVRDRTEMPSELT